MPNNVYAFRRLPEKFRTSWRFVLCVDCEVEYVYEVDIVESKNPFFYIQKVPPVMISRTKVKVANETI